MKDKMVLHINQTGKQMYRAANAKVMGKLNELLDTLEGHMTRDIKQIGDDISKDYGALIMNHDILKALSSAKTDVYDLLAGADKRFTKCLQANAAA